MEKSWKKKPQEFNERLLPIRVSGLVFYNPGSISEVQIFIFFFKQEAKPQGFSALSTASSNEDPG